MKRLKLAVLLSGGGTTLDNLLQWRDRGDLNADVGLVVSSRANAGGLAIARNAGIKTEVVIPGRFLVSAREGEEIRDWSAMSKELDRILLAEKPDLVIMAGFLCRYLYGPAFENRVLNIHPALIPMFCGEGMYGRRVHEAVVASGVRVTGCTVHYADHSYDTGPIILQRCCPVYSDDTPGDVAERVFREECIAYPQAINLIAEGRVRLPEPNRVYVEYDRMIERFTNDVD